MLQGGDGGGEVKLLRKWATGAQHTWKWTDNMELMECF